MDSSNYFRVTGCYGFRPRRSSCSCILLHQLHVVHLKNLHRR